MTSTRNRTPNPDGPEELGQIAFLAGTWDLKPFRLQPNGSYLEGAVQIFAGYTLDGYASMRIVVARLQPVSLRSGAIMVTPSRDA